MFNKKRERKKIMKKIVLALMAVLSMTSVYAADENGNAKNMNDVYEMNFNIFSLSNALELQSGQFELVRNGQETFNKEMSQAKYAKDEASRKAIVDKALARNVKYMSDVLDRTQYHKYLMLLNATINNRGIDK